MADALNSIIGVIMAIPLVLWDRIPILNRHTDFDDLISVLMALFLLVIGWKLVHSGITYHNKLYLKSLRRESGDQSAAAAAHNALLPAGSTPTTGAGIRSIPEEPHRQFQDLDKDVEQGGETK